MAIFYGLSLFFFNRHANEVVETHGWKSMIVSHPNLVADVYKALANQQCPPFGQARKKFKTS
jgi:speckle-type POZ protein